MRVRRYKQPISVVLFICLSIITLVTIGLYTYFNTSVSNATLKGFEAGNIMDDSVMSNRSTMNTSQIQSFLKSKVNCNSTGNGFINQISITKDGKRGWKKYGNKTYWWNIAGRGSSRHFVCMADDKFNGESAAKIIYDASRDYNINPQVLIVLLEKEQSLVTDGYPHSNQYLTATGFACFDDGKPCVSGYAGFKSQVRKAAALFHEVLSGGWTNYPVGNNYIQYNPSPSCGGSWVNIKNLATSALYRYTPYQPNRGALNAGYGTAYCGAYGNRNFYNLFTEWFGSTKYTTVGAIGQKYNKLGREAGVLGAIKTNEKCTLKDGGCYQVFQGGSIYWTQSTGANMIKGGIKDKWRLLDYERGRLGYPRGDEVCGIKNGGCYQLFQGGRIYWSPQTDAQPVWGGILTKYVSLGSEQGVLGYPTSAEKCTLKDGGCYQVFQGGSIYWSPASGAHPVRGGIGSKWTSLGYEKGTLGYPISSEIYQGGATYQDFEGGRIYWVNNSAISTAGAIGKRYKSIQYSGSALGLPTENERCVLHSGGCYQSYQNGAILWSSKTGAWESYGGVRTRWSQLGFENGRMGYPVGPVACGLKNSGCFQSYQNGAIVGNPTTGYWESVGAIRTRWSQLGFENGRMGYPVGGEAYSTSTKRTSQRYEKGTIFWTSQSGAWTLL